MKRRLKSIRRTHLAGTILTLAVLALSAAYVVPAHPPLQQAGGSVHAKNSATPEWMLELETRNAGQSPVTVQTDKPSFWI